MTVNCRYHCQTCGAHFSGLEAFDAHRRGSHQANTRRCIDPSRVRGINAMTPHEAECRISQGRDRPQLHVAVWHLDRYQDRVRPHRRPQETQPR